LGLFSDARADDTAAAAEFFRAATAAYARGEFAGAARAFEQAHEKAPRAATILNAARAWEGANDDARAADDYAAALQLPGLSAAEAEQAKSRLADLERRVGTLQITSPPGAIASVAHVAAAPVPTKIHLKPGEYPVQFTRADGTHASRTVTIAPAEVAVVGV